MISRFKLAALVTAGLCFSGIGASSAYADSTEVGNFRDQSDRSPVPSLLNPNERKYYSQLHDAIESKNWSKVQTMLKEQQPGLLHQHARSEYYLAAGSPRIGLTDLSAWLREGTELPRADQIGKLAQKRGAQTLPMLPPEQRLQRFSSTPNRTRPPSTADGTMPSAVSAKILDNIKNDTPSGAQQLLDGIDTLLSQPARAEWRQRVAWSYYIENQDEQAYRLAQLAAHGSGPWVAEAWWTAGLAAWRLGDCEGAGAAFLKSAGLAPNPELSAAGYYWQSRALVRCRRPKQATEALRGAASHKDTLYGMLAGEQLGLRNSTKPASPNLTRKDWQRLSTVSNIRVAVALSEIGEDSLADEVLRHQARIGSSSQYKPLSRLARDLGLPSTQLWMSYNAPYGSRPEPASRYPTPKWKPIGGWKVDQALIYAHALQESRFRASVVSPAGARGLMQIMPATARQHAPSLGISPSARSLNKPEISLTFGQAHLELLKNSRGTQGLLPKVMAAYNAGLTPVTRWNSEINDQGDPLLWMESIPYWETRGYVNIVMRNYWMYERQTGGPSQSRLALTQGMWPTFPGRTGSKGRRMANSGAFQRGH